MYKKFLIVVLLLGGLIGISRIDLKAYVEKAGGREWEFHNFILDFNNYIFYENEKYDLVLIQDDLFGTKTLSQFISYVYNLPLVLLGPNQYRSYSLSYLFSDVIFYDPGTDDKIYFDGSYYFIMYYKDNIGWTILIYDLDEVSYSFSYSMFKDYYFFVKHIYTDDFDYYDVWNDGYDVGFSDGKNEAGYYDFETQTTYYGRDIYNLAYSRGIDEASYDFYNRGYDDGKVDYGFLYDGDYITGDEAYNLGGSENTIAWNVIFGAWLSTFQILSIELFPGLTLGMIMGFPLILGLLSFIIGVATFNIRAGESYSRTRAKDRDRRRKNKRK